MSVFYEHFLVIYTPSSKKSWDAVKNKAIFYSRLNIITYIKHLT